MMNGAAALTAHDKNSRPSRLELALEERVLTAAHNRNLSNTHFLVILYVGQYSSHDPRGYNADQLSTIDPASNKPSGQGSDGRFLKETESSKTRSEASRSSKHLKKSMELVSTPTLSTTSRGQWRKAVATATAALA